MGCTVSFSMNKVLKRRKEDDDDIQDFQSQLVQTKKMGLFAEIYEEDELLGEGITGYVRKIKHRKTGNIFAMKTINLGRVDKAQLGELRNELHILRKLDHPNVVKLYETYEDKRAIKLVMEMLQGGDLSKRHLRREAEVIDVIAQVLSAILHCHNNGVVHRDLKLENVVFSHPPPARNIKLIDFGLSNAVALKKFRKVGLVNGGNIPSGSVETEVLAKNSSSSHNQKSEREKAERLLLTMCGTAHYMSPEILKGGYTQSCDLWSVGVMTYMLLTGKAPFDGPSETVIFRKIRRGNVDYSSPLWDKISPHAKPFVQGLLEVDQHKRLTAEQALHSKWLQQWSQDRAKALTQTSNRRHHRSQEAARGGSPSSGAGNGGSATDGASNGASNGNGNGETQAYGGLEGDEDQGEETSLEEDVVRSLEKFTTYSKLRKAALMVIAHHQTYEQIRDLRNAFLAIDSDHSGSISLDELKEVLNRNGVQDKESVRKLFEAIDQGRQGEIRYVEFLAATIETRFVCDADALAQAFDHLDEDSSGYITKGNLRKLLGKGFNKEEVEEMVREADFSGDGKISREDFLQLMEAGHARRLNEARVGMIRDSSEEEGRASAPPKSLFSGSLMHGKKGAANRRRRRGSSKEETAGKESGKESRKESGKEGKEDDEEEEEKEERENEEVAVAAVPNRSSSAPISDKPGKASKASNSKSRASKEAVASSQHSRKSRSHSHNEHFSSKGHPSESFSREEGDMGSQEVTADMDDGSPKKNREDADQQHFQQNKLALT